MKLYKLFITKSCHLCEFAIEILNKHNILFNEIDIIEDIQLVEKYGLKIPVLHNIQTQEELNYPFNERDILSFCSKLKS